MLIRQHAFKSESEVPPSSCRDSAAGDATSFVFLGVVAWSIVADLRERKVPVSVVSDEVRPPQKHGYSRTHPVVQNTSPHEPVAAAYQTAFTRLVKRFRALSQGAG